MQRGSGECRFLRVAYQTLVSYPTWVWICKVFGDYRGTHAGHSQGGGIGLSIVSRLCDLYGWQVSVRPGVERGVIATLTFAPAL